MSEFKPVRPTVHLNGTGQEELIQQQISVMDACTSLLQALRAANPHGRDYYPHGEDALQAAAAANDEVKREVQAIYDWAFQAAHYIAEQKTGR